MNLGSPKHWEKMTGQPDSHSDSHLVVLNLVLTLTLGKLPCINLLIFKLFLVSFIGNLSFHP